MTRRLIESVPNISEGRSPETVEAIARAAVGPECWLLDVSSDADHHRSVITLVGSREGIAEGIHRLVSEAVERIDLRDHQGAHPRMGAVDVVPFIPVGATEMEECVAVSRDVGERIGTELDVPVLLYEGSATAPHRRNLAAIRKGEFEGLATKLGDPQWTPDFGPAAPHPSAGAVAVGARPFLIAFNVNLACDDVDVAKRIAAAVRHSSGGLRHVKALGLPLEERGTVQVSMNLTDFRKTPILRVLDLVRLEARRFGVAVTDCEIVGKVPRAALYDVAGSVLQLPDFRPEIVLEERIEDVLGGDPLS
ncbi:MAG: glutamate formimidoyltransferase [Candidatus Bipolaricaulota bacterium]|nr:MAG: glutamate formimidoyltransferase [Candidatus Bipolaricaulota bacterium]